MQEIIKAYEAIGGEFLKSPQDIVSTLEQLKGFVFDWDGVFNAGTKGVQQSSPYAEADAMGTNLLRFGYWLRHGRLPFVAIISGMHNPSAFQLAKREHFDAVYFGFPHKTEALAHLHTWRGIATQEVGFCFDDALDLAAAREAGLRFLVRRPYNPLFTDYARRHKLFDYASAGDGSQYAVREVCELLLGLMDIYERSLDERIAFGELYQRYLQERQALPTHFFRWQGGQVVPLEDAPAD